jgi:hypothetical protein
MARLNEPVGVKALGMYEEKLQKLGRPYHLLCIDLTIDCVTAIII